MGLKYEFHKWPFEQRKQIISQLTLQFAKETNTSIPSQLRQSGFAHTRVSNLLAGGRLQCTRVRVLFKIHSAHLLRAAAELEFFLRSRLTITFEKGNQKEKRRTRVKRTNEQALILSRRTRVEHSLRECRAPMGATCSVILSFPVQCAINYTCINIQLPYKIKYPCKLENKQQATKSLL